MTSFYLIRYLTSDMALGMPAARCDSCGICGGGLRVAGRPGEVILPHAPINHTGQGYARVDPTATEGRVLKPGYSLLTAAYTLIYVL